MGKELTNQQKKDWAKVIFLQENMTIQEIASKVGVSRITLGKWVKEGNWEMYKVALTTTREEQIRNTYLQLAEINKSIADRKENKFPTPAEADTIKKLTAAINDMEKDFGIDIIIGVTKKLLTWMKKRNPEKADEMSYIIDEFIQEKLR